MANKQWISYHWWPFTNCHRRVESSAVVLICS